MDKLRIAVIGVRVQAGRGSQPTLEKVGAVSPIRKKESNLEN